MATKSEFNGILDYISNAYLQAFLDAAAVKDDLALRLWYCQECQTKNCTINENCSRCGKWLSDWSNGRFYQQLFNIYEPSTHSCSDYYHFTIKEIQKTKSTICPKECSSTLWIFGIPIFGPSKRLLGILFGGLVRKSNEYKKEDHFKKLKHALATDTNDVIIRELQNEYQVVPIVTDNILNSNFKKWCLFAECLSSIFSIDPSLLPGKHNSQWIGLLQYVRGIVLFTFSLRNLVTEHNNITKLNIIFIDAYKSKASAKTHRKIELVISNQAVSIKSLECSLEEFEAPETTKKDNLGVFRTEIDTNSHLFIISHFDTISKQEITTKIAETAASELFRRFGQTSKDIGNIFRFNRIGEIFDKISREVGRDVDTLVERLFVELYHNNILEFAYASFSHVEYFKKAAGTDHRSKPSFRAAAVFPQGEWSGNHRKLIENFDLLEATKDPRGSTVFAFQQARTVVDRIAANSPTFVTCKEGVTSGLVLPVCYGQLVLGILSFDRIDQMKPFSDSERLMLENLSRLIAPLVYQATFNNSLNELNFCVRKIMTDFNGDNQIQDDILISLCRLMQAEGASLWETSNNNNTLNRVTSVGDINYLPNSLPVNNSIIGKLFTREINQNHVIKNINTECIDSYGSLYLENELQKLNVHSWMAFLVKPKDVTNQDKLFPTRIITIYRFKHEALRNRHFSEIEAGITYSFSQTAAFYQALSQAFLVRKLALETEIRNRENMATRLSHNIIAPLSLAFGRVKDLKTAIIKRVNVDNYNSSDLSFYIEQITQLHYEIYNLSKSVLRSVAADPQLEAKSFNLYFDIIKPVISMIRRGASLSRKKMNLQFDRREVINIKPQTFPRIYGNLPLFKEAITNIFENAVKYTNNGDKIESELIFDEFQKKIFIKIRNTGGIPISAESKDTIFSNGGRTQEAINKHPSSAGFGLFFSRNAIRQHGGKLLLTKLYMPVEFVIELDYERLRNRLAAQQTLQYNTSILNKES